MGLDIHVHGPDPSDVRADDLTQRDDGTEIANDIHQLLQEDYGYLDVTGVEVDVSSVPACAAADYPE